MSFDHVPEILLEPNSSRDESRTSKNDGEVEPMRYSPDNCDDRGDNEKQG